MSNQPFPPLGRKAVLIRWANPKMKRACPGCGRLLGGDNKCPTAKCTLARLKPVRDTEIHAALEHLAELNRTD